MYVMKQYGYGFALQFGPSNDGCKVNLHWLQLLLVALLLSPALAVQWKPVLVGRVQVPA